MFHWTTGKAHPAMTAAAQFLMMTTTIVNSVTEIIAAIAAAIAKGVTPQCAWVVLTNVPHATSLSAITALPNAWIANKRSARIA